ncbi:tyrosine-type recombinase/integrase [Niveibacterium sp.]|uniref:site-specific integrase n=1 Tax=Niveibacterium sp. TaxID=2017444 RepID=UPI0035AF3009
MKRQSLGERRIEKGIYQRGPCSFQVKMLFQGHALNGTFDTLAEARAFRDSKRASLALDPDAARVLKSRVRRNEIRTFTLEAALERYAVEVTPAKKGAAVELGYIAKIKRHKLATKSLFQIGPDDIADFLKGLVRDKEGPLKGAALTDESKRKYASLLSCVYEVARKRWRLAVGNPVRDIELPRPCKPRTRRLDGDEEQRLITALRECRNTLMAPLAQLAIVTAMRQGELLKLDWVDVRLADDHGTALLHDTKNGEDRVVPLSAQAVAILRALPRPKRGGLVFPMTKNSVRTSWDFACRRAGIDGLRFHDLRHEATSRLFELGLDRVEAAAVTGHKTLQMLKNYTHLRAEMLAKKLNRSRAE